MSSQSTKEIKAKFNKLSNCLIYFLGYVDIESTDTFFSDLENEYRLLGTKSRQIPKMYFSLLFSKKLR